MRVTLKTAMLGTTIILILSGSIGGCAHEQLADDGGAETAGVNGGDAQWHIPPVVEAIAPAVAEFKSEPGGVGVARAQYVDVANSEAPAGSDIVAGTEIGAVETFALTPEPAKAAAERPVRPPLLLTGGGEYQFDAGIHNAGDFSVTRALVGIGTQFPIGERVGVGVSASYDFAHYDFDDDTAFGGGEPWGDIHTARFMATGRYAVNERWWVFAGGVGAVAQEGGADTSSSWAGGGFIGGGYRASDSLTIQLGVSVTSRLEDDADVLPMFVLNWQIDERVKLNAGAIEFGVADAVGVGVTYRIDDHWSIGARVGYVRQQFRLDGSGVAPDGVGQDERGKAALVLEWRPTPELQVSLLGGVAFGGELELKDESGHRLFKEDYDPAPFVGARLLWQF